MRRLFDKLIILLCCLPPMIGSDSFAVPVMIILAAVTFTSLFEAFRGKERVRLLLTVIFCIFSVCCPPLSLLLPIVIYDLCESRDYYTLTVPAVTAVFFFDRLYGAKDLFFMIGTVMAAVFLGIKSAKLEEHEKKLILMRDDNTEKQNLLYAKNQELIEKQDYEVQLATLSERNRIAREIHDNVGHMLSRSILQVGALKIIEKDELVKEQLSSIGDTLSGAMDSIRSSVHRLHDESVKLSYSVNDALSALGGKCEVKLDCDIPESAPTQIKMCFIAIVKEAVSNVIKHSDCTKVSVILREHPAFWQLIFEDNGTPVKKENSNGIGLQNISDRIEALDGVCRIDSNRGYRIFVTVPKEGIENK